MTPEKSRPTSEGLLSPFSLLLSPFSCLMSLFSRFLFPFSRLLSLFSLLLSPFSLLLSPFLLLMSPVSRLLSVCLRRLPYSNIVPVNWYVHFIIPMSIYALSYNRYIIMYMSQPIIFSKKGNFCYTFTLIYV